METLDVAQAAQLLHLHPKRVRSMARDGRLPALRLGRKWLFRREQLEGMLGASSAAKPSDSLSLSARNRLRGRITQLRVDGLMAEVTLRIGDQELVSVITRSSVDRMRLREGDEAFAVVKATEVMIGREERSE